MGNEGGQKFKSLIFNVNRREYSFCVERSEERAVLQHRGPGLRGAEADRGKCMAQGSSAALPGDSVGPARHRPL
jgi:hypothetical protein